MPNDVCVSKEDKKKLLQMWMGIANILDRYPNGDDTPSHMSDMARAKRAARDLGIWIKALEIEKGEK